MSAGLIGGGSSAGSSSSAEDTDTTGRERAPAGDGTSDADINDSDGGGWPLSGALNPTLLDVSRRKVAYTLFSRSIMLHAADS